MHVVQCKGFLAVLPHAKENLPHDLDEHWTVLPLAKVVLPYRQP